MEFFGLSALLGYIKNKNKPFHFKGSKQSSVLITNLGQPFSWLSIVTPPIFEGQLFDNLSGPNPRQAPGNKLSVSCPDH